MRGRNLERVEECLDDEMRTCRGGTAQRCLSRDYLVDC